MHTWRGGHWTRTGEMNSKIFGKTLTSFMYLASGQAFGKDVISGIKFTRDVISCTYVVHHLAQLCEARNIYESSLLSIKGFASS